MRLRTGILSKLSPRSEALVMSRSVMIPIGFFLSVTMMLPTSNLIIKRRASSTSSLTSTDITLRVMISERRVLSLFIVATIRVVNHLLYNREVRLSGLRTNRENHLFPNSEHQNKDLLSWHSTPLIENEEGDQICGRTERIDHGH